MITLAWCQMTLFEIEDYTNGRIERWIWCTEKSGQGPARTMALHGFVWLDAAAAALLFLSSFHFHGIGMGFSELARFPRMHYTPSVSWTGIDLGIIWCLKFFEMQILYTLLAYRWMHALQLQLVVLKNCWTTFGVNNSLLSEICMWHVLERFNCIWLVIEITVTLNLIWGSL